MWATVDGRRGVKRKFIITIDWLPSSWLTQDMKTTALDGAKRAAMAKIQGWANVQSRAHHKKLAARAAGNVALADTYFRAEVSASCRRSRHEAALVAIDKAEREGAEVAAWNARTRKM